MRISHVAGPEHESVLRVEDTSVGLLGFIAIHSTLRGPAVGGLRMRRYGSEEEALEDVLRLSRGMTYKNAAADLPLGGGKAVIMGDPRHDKNDALLTTIGRAIETLQGRYWTAEDMGMSPADMAKIARRTSYVAGLPDGPYASGDPSPVTARGIFNAMRIAARHRFGTSDLGGRAVSLQGVGHVGAHLCDLLHGAGARLIVADIDRERATGLSGMLGCECVAPEDILTVHADIFAPCALGAVLNARTIPQLQVGAVVGGANNQLATPEDGRRLHERGVLFAPDFVVNAGGVINVSAEVLRIEDRQTWVEQKLAALEVSLDAILTRAAKLDRSPNDVAEETVALALARTAA